MISNIRSIKVGGWIIVCNDDKRNRWVIARDGQQSIDVSLIGLIDLYQALEAIIKTS